MSGLAEQDWLASRVKRHVGELVRLAAPVVGSRAGILVLIAVDLAFLGRTSAEQAAYYSLGSSPFVIFMVTGIGLMLGTMVTVSHAFGEERYQECGAIWRRSLPWSLLCGTILMVALFPTETYLLWTGQEPGLARGAAGVTVIMSLSMIPTLCYVTTTFFLEALRRPLPVLVAIAIANVLNLALNPWLVFGAGPIPAMGAEGAALATTIARTVMAVGLMAYVWWLPDREKFGVRRPSAGHWWSNSADQRKYGYAAGLSHGFESLGFGVMHIYAGWIGIQASAVFGMGMNLMALLFMTALGLASATSVRVGISHGRRDMPDRTLAGWVGLGVTTVLMILYCGTLTFLPDAVSELYTDDPALVMSLALCVVIIGFVMLGDGAQIVLSHAIRAAADPWMPTVLNFAAYFVIQIPLGYVFAIHWGRGVVGLFEAIAVGSVVSFVILTVRWIQISRRDNLLSRQSA